MPKKRTPTQPKRKLPEPITPPFTSVPKGHWFPGKKVAPSKPRRSGQ